MPARSTADADPRRAIVAMLIAVALFGLMDAGLKLLSPHYAPLQIAALRGLASLPWVLLWAGATVGLRSLLRPRWSLHLLRGVLGLAMMVGFIFGLRTLPLSTAYAISFIAPLLITAMAAWILHERVGPRRWSAIAMGLLGVLVVLRPTASGLISLGGLAVLLAALAYAVSAITVRVLARSDSNQSMVVWLMILVGFGALALAAPGWIPVRDQDWTLIVGIGIVGALAQVAITDAFRRGQASLIAPLEYTALAWSVCLDLTLWNVLPDAKTWLGAAIIVGSGLYLLRRERVQAIVERP
ncbi:MAG: DMT family transporter [Lysobacteraceae bacterium]